MRAGEVVVVLARARKQRRELFAVGQARERGVIAASRRDEQHMIEPVERGASRRE